jgi:hypothetical protein
LVTARWKLKKISISGRRAIKGASDEKQESIDDHFDRAKLCFVHRKQKSSLFFHSFREFSRSFSTGVELSASSSPRMGGLCNRWRLILLFGHKKLLMDLLNGEQAIGVDDVLTTS